MAVIGKLSVLLGLNNTQFKTGMATSGQSVRRFKGQTQGATAALGKMGVVAIATTLALTYFRAALKIGRLTEEFNQALASSMAIMGDVSEEMRTRMIGASRDVAFQTKFSAKETAAAYYFLASAGLSAEQSIAALPQVALFAQAGMFDLSTATDLATDAQSALGLTVDDAAQNLQNLKRVTDVFVRANQMANASVQQFSEAMTTKAGAALRAVGKDMEEGIAILAVFADQGLKSADAGTKVDIVLRDLQTKAIRNSDAFDKMGISVFDAAGEMRNIADIIDNLDTAMLGMSDRAKKTMLLDLGFTDKSMSAILMLQGTADALREYEKGAREAGGTTQEVADKQLTPFSKAWGKLKDAMKASVSPAMTRFMAMLADGITIAALALNGFAHIVTWTNEQFVKLEKSMKMEYVKEFIAWLEKIPFFGGAITKVKESLVSLSDATGKLAAQQRIASNVAEAQALALGHVALLGKAAEKIQNTLFGKGSSLAASVATPFEKLQSRIKDANTLLSVGAITWQTYGREVAAVRKELLALQAVGDSRPEAAGRNSQAFFAAMSKHRTQGMFGNSMQNQQIDSLVQTEQPEGSNQVVEEAKRHNLLLSDQVRILEALKREAEKQTALAEMTFGDDGKPYDVYPEVVDI